MGNNIDTIKQILDLQKGKNKASIPIGKILEGPGHNNHNAPWKWHFDPDEIKMAEFAMELCDGIPSHIDGNLDYWLNTVGSFCPWSAKLIDVKDYR